MSNSEYRNWQLDYDLDQVCWLTIDRAGESSNSLSQEVMTELEEIVTGLEKNHPKGLVLQSGKLNSFIVGADVREFDQVTSVEEAEGFIRDVHSVFNRIEALPFPTAVIINGYCLGGGLELALCFDYRIAANNDGTRLGFPEVRLGIYPGFGGSARTTRQLGGFQAMQIMLTGRMLRAHQAKGWGWSINWSARMAGCAGPPGAQSSRGARAVVLACCETEQFRAHTKVPGRPDA